MPPAAPGDLDPPAGLTGSGLAEWNRVAADLDDSGAIKRTDLMALENYCRALMGLRLYEGRAKRCGAELAIAKGFANQVIKLRSQVNTLARELGLTPSSRAAIKVAPRKTEESPKDRATRYMSVIRGGRR